MKTRGFVIFLLLLVVASPSWARRHRDKYPTVEWGLKAGLTAIYNDNVLRISEADENAFHRYSTSFRTPLETTDDAESELSLHPSIQWRAPSNLMLSGGYRVKIVNRLKNDFTDYNTHALTASVRPRVKGYRWSAKLGWFLIPSYYLRVYRDRDLNSYTDAKFRNWEYSAEVSYRIVDSIWFGLKGTSGTYYYNSSFTEFDSEYDEVGAVATYLLPKSSTVSLTYLRRLSENVGKDQGLRNVVAPEGSDIISDNEFGNGDFEEDEFSFALRSPPRLHHNLSLRGALNGKLRRRVYTTTDELETDPYHRGRLDRRWEVSPSLEWSVNSLLDISAYYTYEQRKSESDSPAVPLVKDFVRREIGIGIVYALK